MPQRAGGNVSRNLYRRSLVQRGAEYAHKHTRTTYSEVIHSHLHQAESDKITTLSNRQHHCFDLLTKMGNRQQDNDITCCLMWSQLQQNTSQVVWM